MHCPVCDAEMIRQIQSTPSGLVIKDECKCGYSTIYYEGMGHDRSKDNRLCTVDTDYNRGINDL